MGLIGGCGFGVTFDGLDLLGMGLGAGDSSLLLSKIAEDLLFLALDELVLPQSSQSPAKSSSSSSLPSTPIISMSPI
jgi:hypothetical protein